MKFHIVTVYDSVNYGSFFQARALFDYLSNYGQVDFVDIHHQRIGYAALKQSIKYVMKKEIKKSLFEFHKMLIFKKAQKTLQIVEMKRVINHEAVFWFGSDEIWNVHREKIANAGLIRSSSRIHINTSTN